jgi:methionyl-tRNA formyltransferase
VLRPVLYANSRFAISVLHDLVAKGSLAGVVLPTLGHEANEQAATLANERDVPLLRVERHELDDKLPAWLEEVQPDVALVLTFPHRIPKVALDLPRHGTLKFHGGLLPAYRGGDPIFWQVRHGEAAGGISVHRLTDTIDAGPVLRCDTISIVPGETHGIHETKLALACVDVVTRVLEELPELDESNFQAQDESAAKTWASPTMDDQTIYWEDHGADEIERLINACNPKYRGALTYFRGLGIRIVEVTPADVGSAPLASGGAIVHSDPEQGIFVITQDRKFLRVNIIDMPDGVLTGFKLAVLGVRAGERFTTRAAG